METSTSKRRVYSSEQQSSTLSDAASKTNLADLQKGLPPGKKLVEGRNYMVRKSKKRKEYWLDFIEYLEEGSLRSECSEKESDHLMINNFPTTLTLLLY
ncbi:unnamed protein product [Cuscuta europaea]|uniref:Uncharacterized protein n=1 Tax=Cuscuta europaea TaxID=41803 RepID=A0A9P0VQF3_CUSEU|nr:unnamed protein product [Cuscuta europaea]